MCHIVAEIFHLLGILKPRECVGQFVRRFRRKPRTLGVKRRTCPAKKGFSYSLYIWELVDMIVMKMIVEI